MLINKHTVKIFLNVLISFILTITAAQVANGALSYKHHGNKYSIENKFYKAIVSTEGGKIISLYDKISKEDAVYYRGSGQVGGLLDDRSGFTFLSYHILKTRHSKNLIELLMTCNNEKGLSLIKKLYFRKNSPVIEVRESFKNATQSSHIFWTKNFVNPGGQGITKKHTRYFMPLLKGWTSTFAKGHYSKLRSNWAAIIDQPTKSGFAVVADNKLLDKFYFWHGDPEKATFEWIRRTIPAGQQVTGTSYLALLRNMSEVTLVTKDLAANLQPTVDSHTVSLTGKIMALASSVKKATISARITDSRGVEVAKFPKKNVSFNKIEKPVSINITKGSRKLVDGKYLLLATIKIGKHTYKNAPVKFKIGNSADDINVALPPVKHVGLKTKPIKGWVDKITRFGVTDKDKQRGFLLSRGSGKKESRLSDARLKVAVGLNESQALHFTIHSLKDIKNKNISLSASGPLASHLAFFEQNNHRLDPLNTLTLNKGTSKNIWIILRSNGLNPNKYQQKIELDVGSKTINIPIEVEVYPVHLPKKRYLQFKGWAYWPFMVGYSMTPKNMKKLNKFVTAYVKMGGSMLGWSVNMRRILKHAKLKHNGELISKYLKKHKLDLDNLPDLDFSHYNPVLKVYQNHGINRFVTTMGLYPPKHPMRTLINTWFKNNKSVKISTKTADHITVWYLTQLRKYATSHGFKHFWGKVSDEFSPNNISRYIKSAKLMRKAGYKTYSTFIEANATSIDNIRKIAPYADEWMTSFKERNVFHNLTHKRYKLVINTINIMKGKWRQYKNGGAEHTWDIRNFFINTTKYDLNQIDHIKVFEDGKLLKSKAGSAWGNKTRGCFFIPTNTSLYVSPTEGKPENHNYKVEITAHILDPNGKRLIELNPDNQIWFYEGIAHTSTVPYTKMRQKGWIAATEGLDGFGAWTFWWWNKNTDNKMVFYNKNNKQIRYTPIYWGIRDGWEEGNYLRELLNGMTQKQKKETLSKIISTGNSSPLHLKATGGARKYTVISNRKSPQVWFEAKQKLLKALVQKQKAD